MEIDKEILIRHNKYLFEKNQVFQNKIKKLEKEIKDLKQIIKIIED